MTCTGKSISVVSCVTATLEATGRVAAAGVVATSSVVWRTLVDVCKHKSAVNGRKAEYADNKQREKKKNSKQTKYAQ